MHEAPRVTAISLNPLELLSPSEAEIPSPITSDQIKERLLWSLLQGIRNTPNLDLSVYPVEEIKALVTSREAKESVSPVLLAKLGEVFGLQRAGGETQSAVSAETSEGEKFCLCNRCLRRTHSNYIYQTSTCPCQICLICVDQYQYNRCPKCFLAYTDSQREQARVLFLYWSGKFEETESS